MKKALFFMAIFIVLVSAPAFTDENTVINLNLGDFGIGMNAPFNDDYGMEFIATALNIGVENRVTGLGMEFSPFKYVNWTGKNDIEIESISLVNLKLYWNVFNHNFSNSSVYFGPFASVNYMFVEEDVYWDKYVLAGGLHFGLRANFDKINYNILSFEMGYHNIEGISKYFLSLKVDAAIVILLAALLSAESDGGLILFRINN